MKKKAKVVKLVKVAVCGVCLEATAYGKKNAPEQCAGCGSANLNLVRLHEALPEGVHLVKCPGAAHENAHIDNCGICAPRWGVVEVPKQYPSLLAYREAQIEEVQS